MLETANSETLQQIGRSPVRHDVADKLTGAALYVSDMILPGMLYAQVKKSPHARAKIRRIDVSRAKRLPGVRAILTGHDLDYRLGLYVVDKDILAKNEVRHFGEAVAAVAADTLRDRPRGGRADRGRLRSSDADPQPHGRARAGRAAGASRSRELRLRRGGFLAAARHQHRQSDQVPQRRRRKGLRRSGMDRRARVHQPVGAARADGDPRRHRPVEVRRPRRYLDQRAIAVHRARLVLPHLQAAAQQCARRHPQCRRRVRRQGGHPPRAACRLPFPQGRRQAGQVPGDARRGVLAAALPQRADLSHQDRRARRRPHHRAEDGDVLGRRRLRRLCGERHARHRLLGRAAPTKFPTHGSTPTPSTPTSPTARRTAASATSSSSGASSGIWSWSRRRSAWIRWNSAGRTCSSPVRSR